MSSCMDIFHTLESTPIGKIPMIAVFEQKGMNVF